MNDDVAKPYSLNRFLAILVASALIGPVLIVGLGGSWRWVEGWLVGLWFTAMMVGSLVYLYFRDPALLAERSKRPGSDNQVGWDRLVLSGVYVTAIAWLVLMPLDAERLHWSPPFPVWMKVVGGLMLLPSLYLIQCATMENTYMSTLVRVQNERDHRVISSGVYGFVRHPLYLGCVLLMYGAPLLLGSVVGLIIATAGSAVLVVRIIGEENLLATNLDGYDEYRRRVRYRLIPHVW